MSKWIRLGAIGAALSVTAACAQMCAPGDVGTGIARLTVRNLGAAISAVSSDATCGFESSDVLTNPTINGPIGGPGSITWTVADCAIDFGDGTDTGSDCNGVGATVSGKVTISATKTISGTLTGVAENPVLPGGPEAAEIVVTALSFENFEVVKSDSDSSLVWEEGSITATFVPRLAVAADTGACGILTPNAAIGDIRYGESTVKVVSPDLEESVPVAGSSMIAYNGVFGDKENEISGEITVWDGVQTVPAEGDTDGLDSEYDAAKFIEAFACEDNLADPISYVCADMTPLLADGTARLTASLFGAVASAISDDTTCGFSADAVLGAPTMTGSVGGSGTMTWSVNGCTVSFASATAVSTDCAGAETLLVGSATVTGTKTYTGRLTGEQAAPIIPTADDGAVVMLDITFNDMTVSSSDGPNALQATSGGLTGTLTPRLALGSQGACDVQTSIARISDVTWSSAEVALTSASGTFDLPIGASDLDMVNGTWGSDSNVLTGTMDIGGESLTVPSDALGLDPEFVQATHDAGWQCAPGLVLPVSHDCGFVAPLANGVSRLAVKIFGAAAALIGADTTCGFSSPAVVGTGAYTAGLGDQGTGTYTATACTITLPADTVIGADCAGVATIAGGSITVSGTKAVTGWVTGDPTAPIVPTSDDAAVLDLTVTFDNFKVGSSADGNALTGINGTLAGSLVPRLALSSQGVCDVQSSVARLSNLTFTSADLLLEADGTGTFEITVDSSDVNALNGTWDTDSNTLSGTVTVGGAAIPVPIDGMGLDPGFDQATFDASWQCEPTLVVPVVNHCTGNTPLAQGAGRGLINLAALAVNMLDGNDSCGFSALPVLGTGVVTGNPGEMGSMTWTTSASPCAMHIPAPTAVSQDCTGATTHASGTVTATVDKTVVGFLTGSPASPIVPFTRDASTFTITSMVYDGFQIFSLPAGETVPDTVITFSGTLTGSGGPIAGESVANVGPGGEPVYSITTSVAEFTDIQGATGTMTLESGGKTFNLDLADIDLDAFMGTYYDGATTRSNSIAGTVSVEGEPVTLPDPRLDDAFDQTAFDASYVCTPDLAATIPFE